jgi:hypothetical protein
MEMEKKRMVFIATIALVIITNIRLQAQDKIEISKFIVGADLYSNYVWRGTKYGKGPSVQPSLKFVSGGLIAGVWGSFDASGYSEADPYISYTFPVGLSLGLTDYYYPGLPFFEVSDTAGSHAFEINGGFVRGGISLSANYIVNEAGGAASSGGDMYFQAGYAFKDFSLFAGAGNGWHTSDGEFAFCNLGIGSTKTIRITDSFSIPVNGQIILNPEREQLYIVVGFSF